MTNQEMNQEHIELNWTTEAEQIKKNTAEIEKSLEGLEKLDWFKPKQGRNKIKILTNGHTYESKWEDKTIPKVRFDVEVEGKKYSWGVTRGKTESGLYGQLALVGASKGTLVDQEVTVLVMGSGKKTNYVVQEALDLQTLKVNEEKVE